MNRPAGSLVLALLFACSEGGPSTSGLSVGEFETDFAPTAASTSTSTTGLTSSDSGAGTTSDVPTTGPATSTTTITTSTTEPVATGTTGTTVTTEPDTTTTTTGAPACGDGSLDPGEDCDGLELGGATCISLGFTRGELACDASCQLDPIGCSGSPSCALAPDPPGGLVCPPECTGGCDMATSTCNVNCDGNVCDGATIACPDAWACAVSCTGTTACEGITINCPAQYRCDILCQGTAPCDPATFNCGAGPCNVVCDGTTACEGSTLHCGLGDSDLQCDVTNTNPEPVVVPDPASMCLCQAVGC